MTDPNAAALPDVRDNPPPLPTDDEARNAARVAATERGYDPGSRGGEAFTAGYLACIAETDAALGREYAATMLRAEKPVAALPDVRALIARLHRQAHLTVPRTDTWFLLTDAADALEAALRSREGERAEPADAKCVRDGDWCPTHQAQIVGFPPCDAVKFPRPAQPEEAAQRADFNAWLSATGRAEDYANGRDFTANDLREAWAAAQRATPSAPTPNDLRYILPALEKAIPILRAAITDETGTADALDRLRTDLEKRAALADPSGLPEARFDALRDLDDEDRRTIFEALVCAAATPVLPERRARFEALAYRLDPESVTDTQEGR